LGGGDVFVAEYVESEFLARISARQREFLTRTAVLERMCGPLCEAVLEHQAYGPGLTATRQRWIQWLDDRDGMRGHPLLAVQAAFIAAHTGQAAEAERWADAVDRWQDQDQARPGDPAAEAWAAALRAHLCRRGVEQMRADADEFARRIAAQTITVQAAFAAVKAPVLQGIARILCGNPDGGEAFLEAAIRTQDVAAPELRARALCQRSLLAMTRQEWGQAEAFAGQACSVLREARAEDSYVTPLVCAVQARVAAHRGDAAAAREKLVRAQRLRHLQTYAVPAIAVQARIEFTRVHLALADLAGARTLVRETDELLRRCPGLGTLAEQAEALRVKMSRQRGSTTPGPSALTAAELRLLPMLSTHLTAAEIAAELYLSPHTIKSQMQSTYRKLAATSRSQAITRARELGLLEE
jgi:LuxR family maltose regulon positive regulatory protein